MSDLILVLVSAALVSHLSLQQLPVCRVRIHLLGACCALLLVVGLMGAWLLNRLLLPVQAFHLPLLLALLAALAWAVPSVFARLRPAWPSQGLQPALLGNVALLGLLLQVSDEQLEWWSALTWGLLGGAGFWLALALFDDLRQRCQHTDVPTALQGLPIELLGAGVMSMAFSGLIGLFT